MLQQQPEHADSKNANRVCSAAGTTTDPTLGQGGGAIYAASFNLLNLTSTTFTNNSATRVNITNFWQGRGAGGAISINSDAPVNPTCSAGLVSISDCTFTDNHANSGGAVQLVGGGHPADCHTSPTNGSYGRYSASYLASLPYTAYSFCGIAAMPYCTISNSSFVGNSALLGGGSISVLQSYSVQLSNLTFTDSMTPLYGGAVAVANGSAVFSSNCNYTACTAASGGAVFAVSPSESYISSVVLPQFRTQFIYAADVYAYGRQMGSAVTLSGNTFDRNVAAGAGGAVHVSGDCHLVSQGNTFSSGQAGTQGIPLLCACARLCLCVKRRCPILHYNTLLPHLSLLLFTTPVNIPSLISFFACPLFLPMPPLEMSQIWQTHTQFLLA